MAFLGSLFGRKATLAKDPVCGMSVDPANARWSTEHDGTTYYFCAKGCKQAFEAKPVDYAR